MNILYTTEAMVEGGRAVYLFRAGCHNLRGDASSDACHHSTR
jgi:hypothetical protein